MEVEKEVARYYSHSNLTSRVLAALRSAGKDISALSIEDLAGVDEFHMGWGPVTAELARSLNPAADTALLDVGCGIGGPARHFANLYQCNVDGIDLTPAFVDLAKELTHRTGLSDRARFVEGSALALPFEESSFDLATMFHVGMNISDKPALFREVRRVLRPAGRFVVYDLMRTAEGELPMPMPWAESAATSFVETPVSYRAALETADFQIAEERNWTDFVMSVVEKMRQRFATEGLPVIGLHLLMGPTGTERLARAAGAVDRGLLAPIEIVATAA